MSGTWREGIIQSGASRRRKMSANGSGFWKVHTTLFGLEHFHVRRDKQRFSFWSCKSGRCLCQQNWNRIEDKDRNQWKCDNTLLKFWYSQMSNFFLNWKQWSLRGFCVYFFFYFPEKWKCFPELCLQDTATALPCCVFPVPHPPGVSSSP